MLADPASALIENMVGRIFQAAAGHRPDEPRPDRHSHPSPPNERQPALREENLRQGSAGEHSVLRFEMSHVRALEHNCEFVGNARRPVSQRRSEPTAGPNRELPRVE